jgi:hypothetical protein
MGKKSTATSRGVGILRPEEYSHPGGMLNLFGGNHLSNNNQRIFSVLEKIFYKRSDEKDEIYTWDDIFQALSEYISWVDKIKQDFEIKREYDIEHIAEQLFSLGDFNKQICKYHISMLYISLKKIEYELRDSEKKFNVTNDFIKGELALLKDLVWDGSELIGACEKSIFLKILLNNLLLNHNL